MANTPNRNRTEYFRLYNHKHRLSRKASIWIKRGLNETKIEAKKLAELVENETRCWICDTEFNSIENNKMKVLDHDHITGEFRYIACNLCNKTILRRKGKNKKKIKK